MDLVTCGVNMYLSLARSTHCSHSLPMIGSLGALPIACLLLLIFLSGMKANA